MGNAKTLLEPATTEELLRGWLLHAHKSRDRHDEAARQYDRRRYALGAPAIILSAVVGTSVFASLAQSTSVVIGIATGVMGVIAAILVALQTFLDYAGRAERHRAAAVRYKAVIRELEQVLTGSLDQSDPRVEWFTELRGRLDALEEETPMVAEGIWRRVEGRYSNVRFVATAVELSAQPQSTSRLG